jgi:hypothetical protein
LLSGKEHAFEWPNEAAKPEWSAADEADKGDVIGCGLLLSRQNELSIFFTFNGILLGQLFLEIWNFMLNAPFHRQTNSN